MSTAADPTWLSVLPPLLAIGLAVATRQVYLSLAGGIWLGWTILHGWNPASGLGEAVESAVRVLGDAGGRPGDHVHLGDGCADRHAERVRGRGRVRRVAGAEPLVTNGRRAQLLAWATAW